MKSFIQLLSLALLTGSTLFVGGCKTDEKSVSHDLKPVDVQEFALLVESGQFVLLDVRTPDEYKAGHIPGALNIDVLAPTFETQIAQLDPKKGYLVYCRSGRRSERACETMQADGFAQLYDLTSGFNGWKAAGQPVE